MRLALALSLLGIALSGCYDQPRIPKDHPLTCLMSSEPERDCPVGYVCLGAICAPQSCRVTADCPLGTYCVTTNRGGCQLISSDAGGDTVPTPIGPIPGDPGTGDGGDAAPVDAGGN